MLGLEVAWENDVVIKTDLDTHVVVQATILVSGRPHYHVKFPVDRGVSD